ncbi:MAG TPA: acyltransferase [Acidimicrobiales bacterium]|nr:acyltransferase [Acidimicrobiales bacterium]
MDPSVFIHPQALCESDRVGARTRIWAFAHVLPGAVIGADCNICDHAFVEGSVRVGDGVTIKNGVQLFDGVVVEDDVFLGPNCIFTNDRNPRAAVKKGADEAVPTRLERGATVGANATVVCGTTLHAYAFVGAGAVVTRNVPAHAMVVGNPARAVGWMCRCGTRLGEDLVCGCGLRYRLRSAHEGLEQVPMMGSAPDEARVER